MTEEESYGTLILSTIAALAIGYVIGRRTMRRDLLAGLDSAMRIIQSRKEQT